MLLDCPTAVRLNREAVWEPLTGVKIRTSITHNTSGGDCPLDRVKIASGGLVFVISLEEIHAIRCLWACLGIHCPFCSFPHWQGSTIPPVEPGEESRSTLLILRGAWPCVQTPSEDCSWTVWTVRHPTYAGTQTMFSYAMWSCASSKHGADSTRETKPHKLLSPHERLLLKARGQEHWCCYSEVLLKINVPLTFVF